MSTFVEENILPETEELVPQKNTSYFNKWIIIFIVFALVVPVTTLYFMYDFNSVDRTDIRSCLVSATYRVSCGKENLTYTTCSKLYCCFDDDTNECYHYAPSKYSYNPNTSKAIQPTTPWGTKSLDILKISTNEIDENKLKIVLHDHTIDENNIEIDVKNYKIKKNNKLLMLDVCRNTGELLLTTSKGPLIASEKYWEWTVHLGSDHLFGLGEILIGNETLTKVIYNNENDHNTLPIFMSHNNGSFHGLLVEHDGPLEVTVLPSKLIILKSLAGSKIILNVYVGPTPKDVMEQQRLEPIQIYPRWILGSHLCRSDQTNLATLIKDFKMETNLKFNSNCLHENLLMMFLMETDNDIITQLVDIILKIQEKDKFILSIPPHIPIGEYPLYKSAEKYELLYRDSEGNVLKGTYANTKVAFIDFTNANINDWTKELFEKINDLRDINKIDGYILTDNWPVEETYDMTTDAQFPYLTNDIKTAMSKTIPWNAEANSKQHILLHNDYGVAQLESVNSIFIDSEIPIMTSSYRHGLSNPAIIRNVDISWAKLKQSIKANLYHSIFSNPLVSSPVCGSNYFQEQSKEPVCIRWYITASTMPMLRVSSDWRLDDKNVHTQFGFVLAEKALATREMLLYYYYYYLQNGEPIVRPMFYQYYNDIELFGCDEQYMVGTDLLVAQSLSPSLSKVQVYFPSGGWYEFWGGLHYTESGWTSIFVVESDNIMFIRAGAIIPLKAKESESSGFSLVVASKCDPICEANGSIQYENSVLILTYSQNYVSLGNLIEVQNDICNNELKFDIIHTIKIYYNGDTFNKDVNLNICEQTDNETNIIIFPKKS